MDLRVTKRSVATFSCYHQFSYTTLITKYLSLTALVSGSTVTSKGTVQCSHHSPMLQGRQDNMEETYQHEVGFISFQTLKICVSDSEV